LNAKGCPGASAGTSTPDQTTPGRLDLDRLVLRAGCDRWPRRGVLELRALDVEAFDRSTCGLGGLAARQPVGSHGTIFPRLPASFDLLRSFVAAAAMSGFNGTSKPSSIFLGRDIARAPKPTTGRELITSQHVREL